MRTTKTDATANQGRWMKTGVRLAFPLLLAAAMALQTLPVRGAGAHPAAPAGPVRPPASSPVQNPDAVSVYGPEPFSRTTPPSTVTRQFALPAGVVPPYSVHVVNGLADGSRRVTSASIRLNGADLFTASDFNHNVPALDRSCSLKANNTLDVRVNGPADGTLSIEFIATRATLTSVSPTGTAQGQSVTVTLVGRNTHWVPGLTQARFGGEVSVGSGAAGEFGPVTVTSPATATAEVSVSATAALAPRPVTVTTPGTGDAPDESVTLAGAFTVSAATPPGVGENTVTTIAGLAGTPGFADGDGTAARFRDPAGAASGVDGTLFLADTGNHAIRTARQVEQTAGGVWRVTTLAGDGSAGYADGVGAAARFRSPGGVAVDGAGVAYVADTGNHRIRRVAPDGTVTTLAGDGVAGYVDGAASQARLSSPRGVAVDASGVVYVADTGNSAVRTISPAGVVGTLAGDGTAGSNDSPGARLNGVVGVAVDGQIVYAYLADTDNHRIRIHGDGLVQNGNQYMEAKHILHHPPVKNRAKKVGATKKRRSVMEIAHS